MASIFTRPRSPYFWIKFRDGHGTRRESTMFRTDNPVDVRRARQLALKKGMEELDLKSNPHSWSWVPEFLRVQYETKGATLERFDGAWRTIILFLEERKISAPAQLLRQHCFDYMEWRKHPDKRIGKYNASHNTALLELKILRIVMNEAVLRGYCTGNPCVRLKINRAPTRRAPELTDSQIELIRAKIKEVENPGLRHYLTVSFEIGRYQGCRISETRVHLRDDVLIENGRGRIRFTGKGREFTTMLHPDLIPLIERLRADGLIHSWDPPPKAARSWASLQWTKFLTRSGLRETIPNICFRSTRVTVATRMGRNNVSLSKAKEYLKHASTTVHFVYQRLQPEDLGDCADAVR